MTNNNSPELTLETITQGRHYLLVTDGSGPEGCGAGGSATGTGGHAAILQLKEGDKVLHQKPFAGQVVAIATNSRMEMMAPLAAFAAMQEADTPVLVQSDSQFLINGMNTWRLSWEANNWKKSNGQAVLNLDCGSARGLDADRHRRPLKSLWRKGSPWCRFTVKDLRREASALKECAADLTLENSLLSGRVRLVSSAK